VYHSTVLYPADSPYANKHGFNPVTFPLFGPVHLAAKHVLLHSTSVRFKMYFRVQLLLFSLLLSALFKSVLNFVNKHSVRVSSTLKCPFILFILYYLQVQF